MSSMTFISFFIGFISISSSTFSSHIRSSPSQLGYVPPVPQTTNIQNYSHPMFAYNVYNYGAHGNGKTDDTLAFTNAISAAHSQGAGYVYAPLGQYLFTGQLSIPNGITLIGSYLSVPSHPYPKSAPTDGTIFMPTFGLNSTNISDSFITLSANAALKGIVFYYPLQPCTSQLPVKYPPSIFMNGENSAVEDIELLNSFIGIWAVGSARHYIARIQGQPIMIGVFIDETYDIGRIENVHFNPWFCTNVGYLYTQTMFGRSFVFGRSDWEYVFNTFSFAYAIGYHFIETKSGSMNGNFLGIGADYACNNSVKVDASQPAGLLITNGEFTAFHNSKFAPNNTYNSAQVEISESNSGPVVFMNSAFWGSSHNIARVYGSGTTSFIGCQFVDWNKWNKTEGTPAIEVGGGSLILNGNGFQQTGDIHVYANGNTKKVIITSNVCDGGCQMLVNDSQEYVVANNL